ncbi:hypothetical protein [Candidatus Brachybacter algidus]|uniref:hypothetical protein n=1 Tax=Candidatus Brachybacter algidus TaxID=2982024 RepID=UPI00257F65FE|nr:hypothetical protein [Candidatus Brachybacter algidus]
MVKKYSASFPLAQKEFAEFEDYKETSQHLEQRLLFGGYPELEQYSRLERKRGLHL